MKFEVEPNQFVVRIYDDQHPDNYVASALVRKYGDRGWMSSIIRREFHSALAEHWSELLDACEVSTFEGYMTDAHARLLRMATRGKADVTISHRGVCAGREMPWVILRKIEDK